MCAVIFPLIRRLFSSFVLTCFLWTTLFQTIAFADYTRAKADSVIFEEQGDVTYANLNVGARKVERSPSPTAKGGYVFNEYTTIPTTPEFVVPFGKTHEETQKLIDQRPKDSRLHDNTTVVEEGLTWTSNGVNFYRHSSGDVFPSRIVTPFDTSALFDLFNQNGSMIFETDFSAEYLKLSGKDIIQKANMSIDYLSFCNNEKFVNEKYLSVSRLLPEAALRASSSSPTSVSFLNEGEFVAREETTLGGAQFVSNSKTMHFERDIIANNEILENEGIFHSKGAIKGILKALSNQGTFQAEQGFQALRIQEFLNAEKGILRGNGQLILGSHEFNAVNKGKIESSHLAVQLEGDFFNSDSIQADEVLETRGSGTFYQQGTLAGKKVVINNKRFESEKTLDQSTLDLVFGDQVETFHNCQDVTLKTKTLTLAQSASSTAMAVNDGTIHTGHFDTAIETFTNKSQLTATTWTQRGKTVNNDFGGMIDIAAATQFDTDLINNAGDITTGGNVTGRIGYLTNTGGLELKGDVVLSGTRAHNEKLLRAHKGFSWKGDTFTSTEGATLYAQKLDLVTQTPLNLKGVVQVGQEATFTASSIENNASLSSDKGKATFNGEFTNKKTLTVDELVYEGSALTNAEKATLTTNLYTRETQLERLDNAGTLQVHKGGFAVTTLHNTGTLALLDGIYQVDAFDNKGGNAAIDQLSLMSESPTLEGKLTINYFKPAFAEHKSIHIDGDVTLKSGDFKTKELNIKGSLSLGKGHYHIDVLKGDKNAKLLLQSGARITIGDTEYDGDIVPEVSLELNPYQEKDSSYTAQLREDHSIRKTAFNAIPTATPVKKPILEETVFTKSKSIVDAQSDYNRIDPNKKGCDLTEAKSRLQATMGTEITRIIHSAVKKDEIDFQKTLPVLPTTDRLYGHFEIFRHTSSAARDIVQKITTDGMDILDSLSFYVPSFESDFNIIKRYRYDLTRDMFMLWLREVLDEHDEGFTPYKFLKPRELPPVPLPQETQQKGPFQTFIAPNSKPGGITELLQKNEEREVDFNSLSTRSGTTHPTLQNSVLTASTNILRILGQVSSRQATDDEKKNVLQTVMGSQITRVIHEEKEQQAIDLETHLPTVEKTHWSYRHFEILRLTAKLSRTLVQQVTGRGYDALSYVTTLIPDFELDTDTLCTYSGIKRDMFMLWFKEILEQHEEGFTYSTRASLTFLSKASSRSGTLSTGKHVFLKASPASPPEWAANFLRKHKDTLIIDAKSGLTIEADTFSNTEPLDFPYHVHFNTHMFKPQNTLTVKGMTLHATHAQIGSDNDHMVTITCNGTMDVQVEHDLDVRFGLLQSTGSGYVKSKSGKILIGARKNVSDKRVEKNGAMITSTDGELILEALSGGIYNHFGVVKGQTLLHYKANKIENISSDGISNGVIVLDVDDLDHLILNEIYEYETGRSGADGRWEPERTVRWRCCGMDVTSVYSGYALGSSINGRNAKADPSTFRAMGGNITVNCRNAPKILGSHFQTYGSLL